MNINIVLLGILAIFIILIAAKSWRKAVFFTLVLIIFEGGLRKWVLPNAQVIIYFLKDIVLLGAYIGFLLSIRHRLINQESLTILLLCGLISIYGFFQIFNPNSPSILLGIIGWKSYFFYMPLLFMMPFLFRTPYDLDIFLRRYLLFVIPVAMFGIFQFFSGVNDPINAGLVWEGKEANIVTFGSLPVARVSSTFSYISGFSEYLTTMALITIGILIGRRLQKSAIYFFILLLILIAMFTTGSRSIVYSLILLSHIFSYN